MKLVSYSLKSNPNQPLKRGVLVGNNVIPVSGDFNMLGDSDLAQMMESVRGNNPKEQMTLDEVRLGPPLPTPPKIICIGLNYLDHAIESNMKVPETPVIFSKWQNTIVGPEVDIGLDGTSNKVDYEAELTFVIGKTAYRVAEADAMNYVAGYMCGNDVSARELQLNAPSSQWIHGKSLDYFCPIGPFLVTRDEIPDPHNLRISCRVNGKTVQDSNTAQMIFKIPALISYLSRGITLQPGDIVLTGTPPGVGMGRKPPVYLNIGDVCEVEIEGLGVLQNKFVERKQGL